VAAEVRVPALRPKGGNGPRRIRLGDLLTDKFTVSSNGHHPMWARQEPGWNAAHFHTGASKPRGLATAR